MRFSDWISAVCSSDLEVGLGPGRHVDGGEGDLDGGLEAAGQLGQVEGAGADHLAVDAHVPLAAEPVDVAPVLHVYDHDATALEVRGPEHNGRARGRERVCLCVVSSGVGGSLKK